MWRRRGLVGWCCFSAALASCLGSDPHMSDAQAPDAAAPGAVVGPDAVAPDASAATDSSASNTFDVGTKPGLPPECYADGAPHYDGRAERPSRAPLGSRGDLPGPPPSCPSLCLWQLVKNCPESGVCGTRRVEHPTPYSYQVYWNDELCYSYWWRPASFGSANSMIPVIATYTDAHGKTVASEIRRGGGPADGIYCGSLCLNLPPFRVQYHRPEMDPSRAARPDSYLRRNLTALSFARSVKRTSRRLDRVTCRSAWRSAGGERSPAARPRVATLRRIGAERGAHVRACQHHRPREVARVPTVKTCRRVIRAPALFDVRSPRAPATPVGPSDDPLPSSSGSHRRGPLSAPARRPGRTFRRSQSKSPYPPVPEGAKLRSTSPASVSRFSSDICAKNSGSHAKGSPPSTPSVRIRAFRARKALARRARFSGSLAGHTSVSPVRSGDP